mgnify:CR=1 FL=1
MPSSIEENFTRNNAISGYDLYGRALAKNPCHRGHEMYNFSRPFPDHHTCILTLSVLSLGEEKIFQQMMHFHFIT